jgi:excisionase family DNA binding protein
MTEEALTIDEVAERLRLHRRTVERLVRSGRLPAGKFGRVWRVAGSTLDKVLRGELVLAGGDDDDEGAEEQSTGGPEASSATAPATKGRKA